MIIIFIDGLLSLCVNSDHLVGVHNHVWYYERVRHIRAARSEGFGRLKVIQLHVGMLTDVIFSVKTSKGS